MSITLNRYALAPEGSDCTAPYEVRTEKPITVREFLDAVIEQFPNEWGSITIETIDGINIRKMMGKFPDLYTDKVGNLGTAYAHGSMNYTTQHQKLAPIDDVLLNKTIVKISAVGGWTAMDYHLHIQSKSINEITSEQKQKIKDTIASYKDLIKTTLSLSDSRGFLVAGPTGSGKFNLTVETCKEEGIQCYIISLRDFLTNKEFYDIIERISIKASENPDNKYAIIFDEIRYAFDNDSQLEAMFDFANFGQSYDRKLPENIKTIIIVPEQKGDDYKTFIDSKSYSNLEVVHIRDFDNILKTDE